MEQTTKRKNSRAKGASFERKIAKELTDWWGDSFTKTPSSGGLRWGRDQRVTGDIVPSEDARDFPFVIECKKREGWNLEMLLKGTGEVVSWWEQANQDWERLGDLNKFPILVFSKNRSPVYFMMKKTTRNKLPLSSENYIETSVSYKDLSGDLKSETVYVGFLNDLKTIERKNLVELLSKG